MIIASTFTCQGRPLAVPSGSRPLTSKGGSLKWATRGRKTLKVRLLFDKNNVFNLLIAKERNPPLVFFALLFAILS